MKFNNKNILTSTTSLENLLNPTQSNLLDSSEKGNHLNKTLILSSSCSLYNYSQKFSLDRVKSTSFQTLITTLSKSTSTKHDNSDKQFQTNKAYYHVDRTTQTRNKKNYILEKLKLPVNL